MRRLGAAKYRHRFSGQSALLLHEMPGSLEKLIFQRKDAKTQRPQSSTNQFSNSLPFASLQLCVFALKMKPTQQIDPDTRRSCGRQKAGRESNRFRERSRTEAASEDLYLFASKPAQLLSRPPQMRRGRSSISSTSSQAAHRRQTSS